MRHHLVQTVLPEERWPHFEVVIVHRVTGTFRFYFLNQIPNSTVLVEAISFGENQLYSVVENNKERLKYDKSPIFAHKLREHRHVESSDSDQT